MPDMETASSAPPSKALHTAASVQLDAWFMHVFRRGHILTDMCELLGSGSTEVLVHRPGGPAHVFEGHIAKGNQHASGQYH